MNNNMKKVSALMVLSLALGGGAAYAAELNSGLDAIPVSSQDIVQNTVQGQGKALSPVKVNVNDIAIADGYWNKDGKTPMVSLRDLTDALGIELTWNKENKSAELSKGNLWTIVTTGKDQYSYNKMLLTLGTAPEITNGKMYIPAAFAEKVLQSQVSTTGNQVSITLEEQAKTIIERGIITSINQKDKYASVHIGGVGTSGIVLNVGEDTVYQSADGKTLKLADLSIGMTIEAEHATIMTMSLPPQTPTYRITVLDPMDSKSENSDVLGTAGKIEQVTSEGHAVTRIEISGIGLSETSQDRVILNINEDTQIVDPQGETLKPDVLIKDAAIIGFYSPLLTRSLPPIGTAWKLVVDTKADGTSMTDGLPSPADRADGAEIQPK